MKKFMMFFFFFLISLLFTACEKEAFVMPTDTAPVENPNIQIQTSFGFKSTVGIVYVQKDLATGLKVTSSVSEVVSATWTIQGVNYSAIQIWHKFTVLGAINISVTAVLANGNTEVGSFMVTSVIDITEGDPVKYFVSSSTSGTWNVVFLLNKERVRHAVDTNFYYTGTIALWEQVLISPQDKRYIINVNNLPEPTSDVGKFIALKFSMTAAWNKDYTMALIHSGNNWADMSGSAFVRADNPGLMYFSFLNGVITPLGDGYQANYPGTSGDNFVRSDQGDIEINLYFKLDQNYSSSAFVVTQLPGGAYSAPILMSPVEGFAEWGKITIPRTSVQNKIMALRYGPNSAQPNVYSTNMTSSFFYDNFFRNLRLSVSSLE